VTDFASLHTYTGIAGGKTVGVAPCSNIYGLKIFDDFGNDAYSIDVLSALIVVKQHHESNPNAKSVVLMSLDGYCGTTCSDHLVVQLISSMYDLGILFAVEAGNKNFANACLYLPAASPKAITVAASDRADNFAPYSNTGPCVDIIAPGTGVNSACGDCPGTSSYKTMSGASMAAAHVAGTLALLLQKSTINFLAPDRVKKALFCDAVKYKIKNIPVQIIGITVNLLLQIPKNDKIFGGCVITPGTDWSLRLEGINLVFRYTNSFRTIRIAFSPGNNKDYGTGSFYLNEGVQVLYSSGEWTIQEEKGVLYIRDRSSSADRRYAFFPGNGDLYNYGSGIIGPEVGIQVLLKGSRWRIQVESGVLMFRDTITKGEHRFAFWQSDVNM
jgi:subtilisin family serine protease